MPAADESGSALPAGTRKYKQQDSTFYVVGEERDILRDAYHSFLNLPWGASLAAIVIAFFAFNLVFAVVYLEVGGITGATGSFTDALSFSVQTMATIGYGVMHPTSGPANGAMIVESMFSIVFTALTTGLVFAKFSRPTARIRFSAVMCICQFEGKRTLMFRVGNRRTNMIVEAQLHVVANFLTTTREGETFYRAHDLKLARDRQVGMTRGWTVMHVIDDTSPLCGLGAADFTAQELEVHIALQGTDSITMQSVSSTYTYDDRRIRDGHRLVDTLSATPDGHFLVDLRKFDDTVPESEPRTAR